MHDLASNNTIVMVQREVKLKILLYYSALQVSFHSRVFFFVVFFFFYKIFALIMQGTQIAGKLIRVCT